MRSLGWIKLDIFVYTGYCVLNIKLLLHLGFPEYLAKIIIIEF